MTDFARISRKKIEWKEDMYRLKKLGFKRALRKNMTPAELVLWKILRNRKLLNTKWRRQANIGMFIADFLCFQHRLVVEVDGGIHELQEEYDALRTDVIVHRGYRVVRFKNEDVLQNVLMVLDTIEKAIQKSGPD